MRNTPTHICESLPSYLIIDDDDGLRERVVSALQRRGYPSHGFSSTSEALENAPFIPTRIILDLRLRGESGVDALPTIQHRFPEATVLLFSGYGTVETAVRAVKQGAVNFLSKPATIDEILSSFEGESPARSEELPTLEEYEWSHICRVLDEHDGNITRSAEALGLHRRSLQRKIAAKIQE
ncbi:response regulator [bacterium]|nr:response regulator [bacterium]